MQHISQAILPKISAGLNYYQTFGEEGQEH